VMEETSSRIMRDMWRFSWDIEKLVSHEQGQRAKAIEILKIRGVKHDETFHPYEIGEKGIIVYPGETVMSDDISLDSSSKK